MPRSEHHIERNDDPNACLRLVDLRRLHLEETRADETAHLHAHLERCDSCRARWQSLLREAEAFDSGKNAAAESARILARLEEEPAPTRRAWWGLPAIAAAAVVVVAIPAGLSGLDTSEGPPPAPITRTKGGGVGLVMFVKDDTGVRRGEDGERLSEGAQIQFRYAAGGHRHLFVVSVDARGQVWPLYPATPSTSLTVEPEGTHVLEGSVILDDAVGPERVFAVFSEDPLAFEALSRAARAGLAAGTDVRDLLRLPLERSGVAQATLLIVKE